MDEGVTGMGGNGAGGGRRIRRNPRRGARVSPLYQQVYVGLRHELERRQEGPIGPLPSEPALAERFAVSRTTIRKTLARLEAEGLVRRERGRGTFPVPQADPSTDGKASIAGVLEALISVDRSTTAVTLDWSEDVSPPGPVRAAFGPAPCLRIVRLRSHEGRPISFTTLHVPACHAGRLDRGSAGDTPVAQLLEEAGVVAQHTEQAITAVAAAPDVAARLGVASRAPLISMRRLMLDADRRPVLHQESLYAPDRFEYRMTLTRSSLGQVARWTPIA
jgi:GntR family transcriptional regulator